MKNKALMAQDTKDKDDKKTTKGRYDDEVRVAGRRYVPSRN
jgi:hypothetical protein